MQYSDFKIADEGFGGELLKFAGKATAKVITAILKIIAVQLGIVVGVTGLILVSNKKHNAQLKTRLNSLTDGEKQSIDNYKTTWIPALKSWLVTCKKDFEAWQAKNDPDNTVDWIGQVFSGESVSVSAVSQFISTPRYGVNLIEFSDYPVDMEDYEHDSQKYIDMIKSMKPLITKWKSSAKKFAPYFTLCVDCGNGDTDGEELDVSEEYPSIYVSLDCRYIDKMGILKARLPKI